MTTLPQTTPIRLPRAGGNTQLAVPNSPTGIVAAPAAVPGNQMNFADVWRIIRTNWWLIVLFVAAGAAGGYYAFGYLKVHHPVYTAKGLLRIQPNISVDPLHPSSEYGDVATMSLRQQTELILLKNSSMIDKVLRNDTSLNSTSWWKDVCGEDLFKARSILDDNLTVSPSGSQLIDIAVMAPKPDDAVKLVTAIGDQAIHEDQESIVSKNNADRGMLKDRKLILSGQIDRLQAEIGDLSKTLTLLGTNPGGRVDQLDMELSQLISRWIEVREHRNAAVNAVNNFEQNKRDGVTPMAVNEMMERDPELLTLQQNTQMVDMQRQEAIVTNGPASPIVKNLNDRYGRYQARLDRMREEKKADFMNSYGNHLALEKENAETNFAQLDQQVTTGKRRLADVANKVDELVVRQDELNALRAQNKEYDKAIQDFDGVIHYQGQGSMVWAQTPTQPEAMTSPKLGFTLSVGVALGLAISLGIAFLREVTDTSVRSPRDIARVGQLSLLGMVSHEADDPQSSGARLPLVIFEAPHSIMAEQLREVRTRMQHVTSLDTTRTILITSPNPGDGKSTIATNIAAGLALNGRRILLVDSNFRRPELHRIFGVGNESGFSDVLNDVNAFAAAVKETPVPNLSVMASGTKPSNPTELLESQLLLDFIERALEEYDHVIFDSGAMLFSSESVALAPRVDGVMTVVRARTSSRGVLQRMRDSLRGVKAEHLGVVLNGVRSQAGGYYGKQIKNYYRYQNAD